VPAEHPWRKPWNRTFLLCVDITKIIAEAERQERAVLILFASSGLRAGELFGLEVKHFSGNTLTVEQSVWEGKVQTPKTKNAYRQVDLHPTVADWLRSFVGHRKEGFIFSSAEGTARHQSNFLRRSLHPILKKLGIEKQGFHGFRRFRVTHLESNFVPAALIRYWTGHAKSGDGDVQQAVTDRYVKMAKDTKFRSDVAERVGLGFELPNPVVVPGVPRSEEKQVVVSN
jgi:integrase